MAETGRKARIITLFDVHSKTVPFDWDDLSRLLKHFPYLATLQPAETNFTRDMPRLKPVHPMPPAYVKPYVKRGKTDAADAEAV
jgi:hypothetical protein